MRGLPAVAVVGAGLVLALFSGAAACGVKASTEESVATSYAQPSQPDMPFKVYRFGDGEVRFQVEGDPPPIPLAPAPPWDPGKEATAQLLVPSLTTPWGVPLPPGPYTVEPWGLIVPIHVMDANNQRQQGLFWPPRGNLGQVNAPTPPVFVKVVDGNATVSMRPFTWDDGRYWVANGKAVAEVRLSYSRKHPTGDVPFSSGFEASPPLPARFVLVPVLKQGHKEIPGQAVEIIIRPIPQQPETQ
ncbi:hypothetical protein [Caldinitratiruptor microaerophilus]|uniref:Uncharacterized protein n=1 Tax=Caldinitratiruptor microaerophilus TaxID=671077 RepID=A0AA35CMP4_9FIRM|nr:hypothetical protein [Caldinitratiruptor microaerophilus]BDG62144.1 hypothetical protein caldi_32340 [Caldinitratiruptor microaerophilus]